MNAYMNWSKFVVNSKSIPTEPHFGAVLFTQRTEFMPSYDHHGGYDSQQVEASEYFAFPNKELLQQWVTKVEKEGKKFFFFEVKKIGQVTVTVNVDVGV